MQRFQEGRADTAAPARLGDGTMLIQARLWPRGKHQRLASQTPAAFFSPKPRPAPSMKRQSATFWFHPASMESGHTASASFEDQ